MCGICGFLYVDNNKKAEPEILKKMTDAIIHRGPDSEGFFVHNNIALGMRRLKIIDLESGNQPIYNENKDICIVFNGEIYNYLELREDLEKKGHRFHTNTDTEVIIHLYEECGTDCLKKLNGFFGLAIYDSKKEILFIARDRIGIKPLHYYYDGKKLIFGSEIKSILQYPGLNLTIDFNSLSKYLTYEYVPVPDTIYKDLKKLRQGHYLLYKDGKLSENKYWSIPKKDNEILSEEEYLEELERLLIQSVKMRLVSDVPLGCFLSGGIDSSLISSIIVNETDFKLKTFNIVFEEKSFDESIHSKRVSEYLSTEHFEEKFASSKLLELLPFVIDIMDEPFADASIIPTYFLSQFAKKHITVALSGDGGDELFAGYPTYQALKLAELIPSPLIFPLKKIVEHLPVSDENISFDFKLKKFFSAIRFQPEIRNQLWLGSFDPDQKKKLLNKDIQKQITEDDFEPVYNYLNNRVFRDDLDKIQYLDSQLYLQDNMLVKVDRTSMANSLEVRVPYLDYKVVEFVSTIPSNLKLKGFKTKYILKKLANKYLPKDIINRKKKGFGIPVAKWIKNDIKDLAEDLFSEDILKKDGIFDYRYVNNLFKEHLDNKKDNRKLLWALLIFQLWRKKNVN